MTATTRNGEIISIGDEVETNWSPKCLGVVFVVFEINPFEDCESGHMVNVHVKGLPDRILKSSSGSGLDTNWFKAIKCNA